MSEQKMAGAIADAVLNTPEPDKWIDCGDSRPLPMFHMATLMQYGERCAEAALAWLRSQGEPVAWIGQFDGLLYREQADAGDTPLFLAPQPAIPDGWQPIETAPLREDVAIWTPSGQLVGYTYDHLKWYPTGVKASHEECDVELYEAPTHWMPLPPEPTK